jgi:hypothetical protein
MDMKNKLLIRIAAILLILHGFIEIMGLFALFAPAQYVASMFINFGGMNPTALADNVVLISIFGVLWGITRIIAAIGILRSRKWALALGIIISVITLIASISIIPSGVMDSLFAIPVLVLLLKAWFGNAIISE